MRGRGIGGRGIGGRGLTGRGVVRRTARVPFGSGSAGSAAASAYERLLTAAADTGARAVYDHTNPNTRTLRVDGSDSYIAAIADGLGNDPDMVQATEAAQWRLLASELGQLDAAEGAVGRYMQLASAVSMSQPNHYITVAQSTSASTTQKLIDGITSDRNMVGLVSDQYSIFADTVRLGGTTDTDAHVYSCQFNSASCYLRIDAAQVVAGNAGPSAMGHLRWGERNGLSEPWLGPLGPLIVYDTIPSDTDRDQMEDLLHELTGIAKA